MLKWQTLAASVPGSYHLKHNKANEDACLLASKASGELILLLADGAGSASCAEQGSSFVLSQMLKRLTAYAMPQSRMALACDAYALLYGVRADLLAFAKSERKLPGDYAATLLAVVVGSYYSLVLQLGDGAIVAQDFEGQLKLLSPGFRGEYASETVFVSSKDALAQLSLAVLPSSELRAIALLSDGLEPLALQAGKPFAAFFEPLFAFCAKDSDTRQKAHDLSSFLASERLLARSHDDKTLILATRR